VIWRSTHSGLGLGDDEDIEQVEANGRSNEQAMAAMSGAWLRRKVRHSWDGGPHRLTMYFATLELERSQSRA
jgi:hypothetical protein